MKHVAVLMADWRAERAAPRPDCGWADSLGRPPRQIEFDPASEGFDGYDAKNAEGGSRRIPFENLKPNIYYKAQDFVPRAHWAPGRRGLSRADCHFSESTSDEGELVGFEVNTQPGMTEMSLAPEMATHAGFSFDEPVAWMVEDASCDR